MIFGDGFYQVLYMFVKSLIRFKKESKQDSSNDKTHENSFEMDFDDQRRTEFFLKDQIPRWVAFTGYVALAIISIIAVSHIFPQIKWYHVLVVYLVAPLFAFCNAYGCGLTDWSLASNYGKIAILVFSAWVGVNEGGVVAGLAACGVMMNIV